MINSLDIKVQVSPFILYDYADWNAIENSD